ncbi:unnamed protein product [Peniophora sp. CBMAI 1063]|nr:unnamed protein product [Peniophora sp. CBMAI 1063]
MLFLVLLTSFIRQSWNLGVAFLCFWLLLDNLTLGINSIIWSDNADVKLYVYCDIVSHMQLITFTVKPMATLILTRRLYLITTLRRVELSCKATDRAVEWILGLVIPVLVAGPLYFVVQGLRFQVDEAVGCRNSTDGTILSILLISAPSVIPPLMSIFVYYPHIVSILYSHSRELDGFLQSNNSVSRTSYFRILALASIDLVLTLPIGIVSIVLDAIESSQNGPIPFYNGWTDDHQDWTPKSFPYPEIVARGPSTVALVYFGQWTSPVLAFVIFALLGATEEACASYRRIISLFGGRCGWGWSSRMRIAPSLPRNVESGELGLEERRNCIDPDIGVLDQAAESGATRSDVKSGSDKDELREAPRYTSNMTRADAERQAGFEHAPVEI